MKKDAIDADVLEQLQFDNYKVEWMQNRIAILMNHYEFYAKHMNNVFMENGE